MKSVLASTVLLFILSQIAITSSSNHEYSNYGQYARDYGDLSSSDLSHTYNLNAFEENNVLWDDPDDFEVSDEAFKMFQDFNVDEALISLDTMNGASASDLASSSGAVSGSGSMMMTSKQDTIPCEKDYGYPDPDWSCAFEMTHAFSNALAIFDKYADRKIRRWSDKFRYNCNVAVARDLFSKDEAKIKRAVKWLQIDYEQPNKMKTLHAKLGDQIYSWKLVHGVSRDLNWSVPKTIAFLSEYLTHNKAKDVREAKPVHKPVHLQNLIEHVCGPLYVQVKRRFKHRV